MCDVLCWLQDYSEVFADNKFDLAIDCLPGESLLAALRPLLSLWLFANVVPRIECEWEAGGMHVANAACCVDTDIGMTRAGVTASRHRCLGASDLAKQGPLERRLLCTAGQISKLLKVLKPTGHLSHIVNNNADREEVQRLQQQPGGPSASMTLVKPDGPQLREVFDLIAAGKVRLHVAQVSKLSTGVASGWCVFEAGRGGGVAQFCLGALPASSSRRLFDSHMWGFCGGPEPLVPTQQEFGWPA